MAVDLPIYLDNHATTPVDPRVLEAMLPLFSEEFGNAASRSHAYGWYAEAVVERARAQIAEAIGAAEPRELVFTSGATESNNLAILGLARARRGRGADHIVTVETEHPAVLDPCAALEREGFRVTRLAVDSEGLVDVAALGDALDDRTALVSVMLANNEIGVVQPVEEIGALCRVRGVPLHSDAAQAVGKLPVDVATLGVDLLSISGHKLYGPKGVGALYVRRARPRLRLEPLQYGGGHEYGLRSGTLPVPLIEGLAHAVTLAVSEREAEAERLLALRERLAGKLEQSLEGVRRNGHPTRRLPGNLHVSFAGIDADALIAGLPGLALSTGSACSSAAPEPSHVLLALGHDAARVRGGIRIGIGRFNTRDEIDRASELLVAEVQRLRGERAASRPMDRAANLPAVD